MKRTTWLKREEKRREMWMRLCRFIDNNPHLFTREHHPTLIHAAAATIHSLAYSPLSVLSRLNSSLFKIKNKSFLASLGRRRHQRRTSASHLQLRLVSPTSRRPRPHSPSKMVGVLSLSAAITFANIFFRVDISDQVHDILATTQQKSAFISFLLPSAKSQDPTGPIFFVPLSISLRS